jgi:hypothetical protein
MSIYMYRYRKSEIIETDRNKQKIKNPAIISYILYIVIPQRQFWFFDRQAKAKAIASPFALLSYSLLMIHDTS